MIKIRFILVNKINFYLAAKGRLSPAAPLRVSRMCDSCRHLGALKARSSTSSSTPLGDDSCGVSKTHGRIEHLQQLGETTGVEFPALRRFRASYLSVASE